MRAIPVILLSLRAAAALRAPHLQPLPPRSLRFSSPMAMSPNELSDARASGSGAVVSNNAAATRKPATAYFKPLQPGDLLESTPFHRASCAAAATALLACVAKLVAIVGGSAGAVSPLGLALAALVGIEFADFGSGCYHFGCDNYGNRDFPVFGKQIEAFQGHHERPWTITHRETCNNLHQPSLAGLPVVLFFLGAVSNPYWLTWGAVAMACIISCQELHKWSHTLRSDCHPVVAALQDAGLIVNPKAHLAHHRSPFDIRYCIVTGHCNGLLDRLGFFGWVERLVHRLNGVKPRSWTLERFEFAEVSD